MKFLLLSASLCLLVIEVSVVAGTKCFKAGMTGTPVPQSEISKNHTLENCGDGVHCFTWIRIYDGYIVKGCASQNDCIYKRETCTKDGTCEYNCCKVDACNAAPHSSSPVSVMVLLTAAVACVGRLLF